MYRWVAGVTFSGVVAIVTGISWGQFQLPTEQMPWVIYITLLNASGYLSFFLMTAAVGLSARLALFERHLGGLDRLYVLHRRLGEIGIGLGVFHYLLKLGAKTLRKRDVLRKPEGWESETVDLFGPLHGIAKVMGEWGLYAALVLLAVA